METREENLLMILKDIRAAGVRYKLVKGVFKIDPNSTNDDTLKEAIDLCRPGLSMILRIKEGLCADCGLEKAQRPQREKRWCQECYNARVQPTVTRLMQSVNAAKQAAKMENAECRLQEPEQNQLSL